jgi:hypothetical protein
MIIESWSPARWQAGYACFLADSDLPDWSDMSQVDYTNFKLNLKAFASEALPLQLPGQPEPDSEAQRRHSAGTARLRRGGDLRVTASGSLIHAGSLIHDRDGIQARNTISKSSYYYFTIIPIIFIK